MLAEAVSVRAKKSRSSAAKIGYHRVTGGARSSIPWNDGEHFILFRPGMRARVNPLEILTG